MSLSIRSPLPHEAGLVLDFVRELAAYEKLADHVDATEAMVRETLFSANPKIFCDFAEWSGVPVGYSLWFLNYSSFRGRHGIYLEDVFVRPTARGRGIGKALMAKLAQRCITNGWTRFEWSVLDWNAPSIAFYESIGAIVMENWKICRVTGDALNDLASQSLT